MKTVEICDAWGKWWRFRRLDNGDRYGLDEALIAGKPMVEIALKTPRGEWYSGGWRYDWVTMAKLAEEEQGLMVDLTTRTVVDSESIGNGMRALGWGPAQTSPVGPVTPHEGPILRIRFQLRGEHVRFRVFAGRHRQTFAPCGTITMRQDEAEAFLQALQRGPCGAAGSGLPVEIAADGGDCT